MRLTWGWVGNDHSSCDCLIRIRKCYVTHYWRLRSFSDSLIIFSK
jgi:hypothetical protein